MKEILKELTVDAKEASFQSFYEAERLIKSMGYDCGSMDYPRPIALVKGNYYEHHLNLPHKWHNFTKYQRDNIDGIITGNFRNGPLLVTIYK